MGDIYTKVPRIEYLTLIRKCETLEKENAKLKADLKKATTKTEVKADEKTAETKAEKEIKKGGNK